MNTVRLCNVNLYITSISLMYDIPTNSDDEGKAAGKEKEKEKKRENEEKKEANPEAPDCRTE